MTDLDALYVELQDDLQVLADPLFDFAGEQVAKRGAFLPFGAVLNSLGEVDLHGATGGADVESPAEVLPLLHEGLLDAAADALALAVCEWVSIQPDGGKTTDAIKVLVEHSRGLTVAFYLPMRKKLIGGWVADEMLVMPADPEVGAW